MTLFGCPVCVGDPSSPMTQAAQAGVLFMLGVVVVMLGSIGSIAFTWARRAKKLAAQQVATEALALAAADVPAPLATA
jgi:hypothetical protein